MRAIEFTADTPCTVEDLLVTNGVSKRLIRKLKHTQNAISKNGTQIKTVDTLDIGDSVVITLSDCKMLPPNSDLHAEVLYEDEDIIVFDKPSDMPVHPSIKHYGDSLGNLFCAMYPDTSFRPLNRLDKDTTGVCICAKNAFAANCVSKSLKKVYYAVVCGRIEGKGVIDLPIARADGSIIMRHVSNEGQNAVTEYETVSSSAGGRYTLLKIKLGTGRTHQIRVHFSHIGYPLAGDEMYGGELYDIKRQALHCAKASFVTVGGKKEVVKSELPDDIKQLMTL